MHNYYNYKFGENVLACHENVTMFFLIIVSFNNNKKKMKCDLYMFSYVL